MQQRPSQSETVIWSKNRNQMFCLLQRDRGSDCLKSPLEGFDLRHICVEFSRQRPKLHQLLNLLTDLPHGLPAKPVIGSATRRVRSLGGLCPPSPPSLDAVSQRARLILGPTTLIFRFAIRKLQPPTIAGAGIDHGSLACQAGAM